MAEIIPIVGGAKLTKDIVKEFGSAFKDLKTFGESGAREVRETLSELTTILGVIDPLILPLKLLTAQITTGTFASSMEFSESLVKLLKEDSTQTAIKGVITLLNLFLEGAAKVVNQITTLDERFTHLQNQFQTIGKAMTDPIDAVEEKITGVMTRVETAITAPFDRIEAALTKITDRVNAVVAKLNPFD